VSNEGRNYLAARVSQNINNEPLLCMQNTISHGK
jgi:hypothetical protein